MIVGCCDGLVPATLYATITDNSGGCGCGDGIVAELAYDESVESWVGSAAICGNQIDIQFFCSAPQWGLNLSGCAFEFLSSSGTCDPVFAEFRMQSGEMDGCCNGGGTDVTITVTE